MSSALEIVSKSIFCTLFRVIYPLSVLFEVPPEPETPKAAPRGSIVPKITGTKCAAAGTGPANKTEGRVQIKTIVARVRVREK